MRELRGEVGKLSYNWQAGPTIRRSLLHEFLGLDGHLNRRINGIEIRWIQTRGDSGTLSFSSLGR